MRGLTYSPEAVADLEGIALWLTQAGSGHAARRTLAGMWTAIERLVDAPCLYPPGPHGGARELPCRGGYRVVYRVVPDTGLNDTAGDVRVLRVFGPGQDRRIGVGSG